MFDSCCDVFDEGFAFHIGIKGQFDADNIILQLINQCVHEKAVQKLINGVCEVIVLNRR